MQRKRWLSLVLCLSLIAGLFAGAFLPTVKTEAAKTTIADMDNFTFNGTMSQEVLRSYCAHAVTLSDFCIAENFEENLRMVLNTGAKFIGRAAMYSWSGNMSWTQIQNHYKTAKERAAQAHKADPELILQAGVFEIIYRGTVESTPIPAFVFEAFGLPVEERNFRYDDMVYTSGEYAENTNYWGTGATLPNIYKTETQMYFYWQITQYIDAGFESVHLGQATLMGENKTDCLVHWDKITTLGRQYAKTHARRGIVLFDCHVALGEEMKIGNRLITDIHAAGLLPNETGEKDGAQTCRAVHYSVYPLSQVGRAAGGEHPLGFTCEKQFMILELDNYGGNGNPGVATQNAFYSWGYDEITWFALQPEWYRNQFLAETQEYLSTDPDSLDSKGEQICFIQFPMRRVITAQCKRIYYANSSTDHSVVTDAADKLKNTTYTYDTLRQRYDFTVSGNYHANNQSDLYPIGSNQEAVIKAIMAGDKVDEALFDHGIELQSAKNHGAVTTTTTKKTTTSTKAPVNGTTKGSDSSANTQATQPAGSGTTTAHGDGDTAVTLPADVSEDTVTSDATPEASETPEGGETSESAASSEDMGETSEPAAGTDTDPKNDEGGMPVWAWIVIAVAAVAVVGVVVIVIAKKGRA